MIQVRERFSLAPFNTFGIFADARYFSEFHSADDLSEILANDKYTKLLKLILGGGSNLLLTKNFDGIVLQNKIVGIEILKEDRDFVYLRSGAGVTWHELVRYAIDNEFAGLENLSLIPGSVGAAPMQNIGAYGVELKEVFHSLEAIDLGSGETKIFSKEECRFGYRESVFKNIFKNKFVIINVTFQLRKVPVFNTKYGAIEDELKRMKVNELSIRAISEAVCNIRRSKLPDPKVTGNAGSFFKNPEVKEEIFLGLKQKFPDIIAYPASPGKMKIAAGWMIEKCGWKGKKFGNAGVHDKQALVIVNLGHASGKEILDLSFRVKESVKEKFGLELETEVNII